MPSLKTAFIKLKYFLIKFYQFKYSIKIRQSITDALFLLRYLINCYGSSPGSATA